MGIKPSVPSLRQQVTKDTVNDDDDMEDMIAEVTEGMWNVAGYIQSNEPLQARTEWDLVMSRVNAIQTYVQNLPLESDKEKK